MSKSKSPRYKLEKEDMKEIGKVIAWTVASTIVALLIALMQDISVPAQYAWAVPIVNSLLYTIKKWIKNNRKEPIQGV